MQKLKASILTTMSLLFCNIVIPSPILEIVNEEGKGLELRLPRAKQIAIACKQKIEDLILHNPNRLLRDNTKTADRVIGDGIIDDKKMEDQKENPIWLLTECISADCVFNRAAKPQYRKQIEDNVTMLTKKDRPLVYASFGAGYLFQDLVMLTKLIRSGHKDITTILIDSKYTEYIEAINKDKKDKIVQDDIFDKNPAKGYWLRGLNYRFMQLLQWIEQYKDVKHRLIVYPNMRLYANDCQSNPSLKADIFLAIDWLDDTSANNETISDIFVLGVGETLLPSGIFAITDKYNTELKVQIYRKKESIDEGKQEESFEDFAARNLEFLEFEAPSRFSRFKAILNRWKAKLPLE